MIRRLHARIAMFAEKLKEIIPLDEVQLAGLPGFGRDLVRGSGDGGMEPEHFARLSDLEDQSLPIARRRGKFHTAFAKHVDAAWRLSFDEQNSPGRIGGGEFDFFEAFQRSFR
jgi:hypothetical protein